MKDKVLEENIRVMKNVIKLAPSLIEISSKMIKEIENNDSIVEAVSYTHLPLPTTPYV